MNKASSEFDKTRLGNPRTQTLVLMIGIAALTLIAVWAVPKFTDPQSSTPSGDFIQPRRAEPAIAPPPQITAPGSFARQEIEAYRESGARPNKAFEEGARQLARGRGVDAYLLYFYAARQGHTGAALALGTQADPAYHDPVLGFIDRPNVTQAVKWYRMAANAGDATARERLADLQSHVEREAAQGDDHAQRLTLLWR